MAGDKDGKTEKPTPKRLSEARKEGNIPRSAELVSWSALFLGLTMLQSTVGKAGNFMQREMESMRLLIASPDIGRSLTFFVESVREALMIVAPLTLTFMVIGVVGHLAQVRILFTTKPMKPKLSKINPISGLKRLFSPASGVEAAKQIVKTAILGYVAYRTLTDVVLGLARNGPYDIGEIMRVTVNSTMTFIRQGTLAGVVISLFDYAYQRRKVGKGLMMTKQEIKEEAKSGDLPPEIKGKIRQKQRQLSQNRMMSAIKDANVVIVNPVHIAIALTYDPKVGAPKVVAKGAGFLAERIKERAEEHRVPLVQDVPLARTLHRACDVDDEIPGELFEAVAKVLAFVFALSNRGMGEGLHRMPGSMSAVEADLVEKADQAKPKVETEPALV